MDPLVADGLLALVIMAYTLAFGSHAPLPDSTPRDGFATALLVLTTLPLTLRRLFPMQVLLVISVAFGCYLASGYPDGVNAMGGLIAVYTVVQHRPNNSWLVIGPLACMLAIHARHLAPFPRDWFVTASGFLPLTIACVIGEVARKWADRNRQLADLTARLRRDREAEARRVATEERVRIARELHDIVAHHMSVVSLQARVAQESLATDARTASAAVSTIVDTSGEALDELRRLMSVLRLDNGAAAQVTDFYDPQPGLDQLDDLLGRVRAVGVPVELSVVGTARLVSPGADLCAFRVIQESLTNVIRHAQPARAKVVLHYRARGFTVTIDDDGHGQPNPNATAGHGVVGMRERAKLYGGTLTAGPRPDGGFRVTLTLPIVPAVPELVSVGDAVKWVR